MIDRTDQASDLAYPADCLSRAPPSPRTAVIEGRVIATVVEQFRGALPNATIYVFDNASNDDTSARASEAGAIVRLVRQRGKATSYGRRSPKWRLTFTCWRTAMGHTMQRARPRS